MNNTATNKGGAIYVDTGENDYGSKLCFYQLVDDVFDHVHLPKIIFINNTAGFAGDSVYGGFDRLCYVEEPA